MMYMILLIINVFITLMLQQAKVELIFKTLYTAGRFISNNLSSFIG